MLYLQIYVLILSSLQQFLVALLFWSCLLKMSISALLLPKTIKLLTKFKRILKFHLLKSKIQIQPQSLEHHKLLILIITMQGKHPSLSRENSRQGCWQTQVYRHQYVQIISYVTCYKRCFNLQAHLRRSQYYQQASEFSAFPDSFEIILIINQENIKWKKSNTQDFENWMSTQQFSIIQMAMDDVGIENYGFWQWMLQNFLVKNFDIYNFFTILKLSLLDIRIYKNCTPAVYQFFHARNSLIIFQLFLQLLKNIMSKANLNLAASIKRKERDIFKLRNSNHSVKQAQEKSTYQIEFHGPKQTFYQGGKWRIILYLPEDYPYKSPSVGFLNKIFHPNIDLASGSVCLDVINQTWTPMYELVNIFQIFLPQLLTYPNPASPLNHEAANLYTDNIQKYEEKVKEYIIKYAMGDKQKEKEKSKQEQKIKQKQSSKMKIQEEIKNEKEESEVEDGEQSQLSDVSGVEKHEELNLY